MRTNFLSMQVLSALAPILYNLPGKLVAIDGRSGTGKTTLGRYLAWRFNVSLVESDLFLVPSQGTLVYHNEAINRVIARRIEKPRPVIVEGVAVLRLLAELSRKPDFVIYVSSSNPPESRSLQNEIESYEAEFLPQQRADLAINLDH